MINLDLNTYANGELKEKLEASFEKVFKNMADKNTPWKDKRESIITFTFTQNEDRNDVECTIQPKEKLATQTPTKIHIATGTDLNTGEIYAEEYGGGIRGQISMDEAKEDNVVDFRKQEVK